MGKHIDSPTRAKLRGSAEVLEHFKLLGKGKHQIAKIELYEYFGVSERTGQRILKDREIDDVDTTKDHGSDPNSRTLKNDTRIKENRHGKIKFSDEDADKLTAYLKKIIDKGGPEADRLSRASWVEISGRQDVDESTIAKKMRARGWYSKSDPPKAPGAPKEGDSETGSPRKRKRKFLRQEKSKAKVKVAKTAPVVTDTAVESSTPVMDPVLERSTSVIDPVLEGSTPMIDPVLERSAPVMYQVVESLTPITGVPS